MSTTSPKQQLRQQALERRRGMSGEARAEASGRIHRRLLDHLAGDTRLHDAPLLLYRSFGDEVDTAILFESFAQQPGRSIYAPVTHQAGHMHWRLITPDTRWQRGDLGIMEPQDGKEWSGTAPAVVACPLVGFDRAGNRLGLGKGCFDRWLAGVQGEILQLLGLAFACQECDVIPAEAHDIPLHVVITETEAIACRNF